MVDFMQKEFYNNNNFSNWRPFSTCSYDSCITDEGYHTTEDEKTPSFSSTSSTEEEQAEQEEEQAQTEKEEQDSNSYYHSDNEIPILKSNRNM
jgi:hypothetical protein